MSKLLELSKKYGFKVDSKSLIVPGTIETEDLQWLLAEGYHLTFELSPLHFIWCERFLKGAQKEREV
jgi:hypothetical protein